MSDARARFHDRLLGRMLLLVILPTSIVLALVIGLAVRHGFANLRRASLEALRTEVTLDAAMIEGRNRHAVVSAQRMAEAQMAGMFGDRPTSLAFARRVLESSPEFTGAYFGYEPDADGRDAESLGGSLPEAAMSDTGRFIPYWFVALERGAGIELEKLVDMETSLYYQGAKEAFTRTRQTLPLVTEPYVYQGKMIVEQVYPIVIDGAFAGVAGVDRALTDLEQELRELAERIEAEVFLVSSRGKFIAATTDPIGVAPTASGSLLKTRPVADTPYRELLGPMVADARDGSVLRLADDPTDEEPCYFAAAQFPTGAWTIVIRRPEHAIVGPLYAQLRFGVLIVGLGLVVVIALLVIAIVRVSRRVNIAVAAADRVARGDLTQDVDPGESRDETGVLLRSLRTMTDNLNGLVGQVKQASIQINSTATELAAMSRQQEEVAGTFGASASQIAAAVKQISATGGELAGTMDDVSRVAASTAGLASEGRAGLEAMQSTMRGLDEATVSFAEKLGVINDKAGNITGVVTTISKVADQTNLLSVNAAIEAEKAGEYGVGFLVVAREIRRLADQTAAATLDIGRMVEQMQSSVSTGVMEMDRFADQVRRSVTDVVRVSDQLGCIIEQVNQNKDSFERVNEGVQSQSQGADQISEAMGQLTVGATRTIESIREYAHAADDLQSSIAGLKSSIATFELRG